MYVERMIGILHKADNLSRSFGYWNTLYSHAREGDILAKRLLNVSINRNS